MKYSPTVFVKIISGFTFLIFLASYLFYISQVKNIAHEVVSNWLEAEAVSIQQGNLLVSIAKGYRLTNKSVTIRGVVVTDFSKTSRDYTSKLFSIGKEPDFNKIYFIKNKINTKASILGKVSVYFQIDKPIPLGISFLVYPGRTGTIFLVFSVLNIFLFIVSLMVLNLNFKNQIKIKENFIKIVRQAAHDIRSPLSNLYIISKKASGLKQNEQRLIQKTIVAINEVAEDLLMEFKIEYPKNIQCFSSKIIKENIAMTKTTLDPIDFSSLLKDLVENKRLEYSEKHKINICNYIDQDTENVHIRIEPKSIKRALSNLINNSVESINPEKPGYIALNLSREDSNLILEIRDNGIGIGEKDLDNIINEGVSVNKPNGNGLGLKYAREVIEKFHGSFNIFSKVGIGTTIRLTFPIFT